MAVNMMIIRGEDVTFAICAIKDGHVVDIMPHVPKLLKLDLSEGKPSVYGMPGIEIDRKSVERMPKEKRGKRQ